MRRDQTRCDVPKVGGPHLADDASKGAEGPLFTRRQGQMKIYASSGSADGKRGAVAMGGNGRKKRREEEIIEASAAGKRQAGSVHVCVRLRRRRTFAGSGLPLTASAFSFSTASFPVRGAHGPVWRRSLHAQPAAMARTRRANNTLTYTRTRPGARRCAAARQPSSRRARQTTHSIFHATHQRAYTQSHAFPCRLPSPITASHS